MKYKKHVKIFLLAQAWNVVLAMFLYAFRMFWDKPWDAWSYAYPFVFGTVYCTGMFFGKTFFHLYPKEKDETEKFFLYVAIGTAVAAAVLWIIWAVLHIIRFGIKI